MALHLKRACDIQASKKDDRRARETAESILADVEQRGDEAAHGYSARFGGLSRRNYRLTDAEIRECMRQLSAHNLDDIAFAQARVRVFRAAARSDR